MTFNFVVKVKSKVTVRLAGKNLKIFVSVFFSYDGFFWSLTLRFSEAVVGNCNRPWGGLLDGQGHILE